MIESKSFGSKAFKVINAIILILLAFSCFYPLWYTFCVSISSKAAAEGCREGSTQADRRSGRSSPMSSAINKMTLFWGVILFMVRRRAHHKKALSHRHSGEKALFAYRYYFSK